MSCEEVRALAAELALGIADGEERARALRHIADCAECRREVEQLSGVADALLTLAPAHEPPVGFEVRALERMGARPGGHPPWRRRLALVLTAAVAASAITAAGLLMAFRDDRRIADAYRATLETANGRYFLAADLTSPSGREAGQLFAYEGDPSWILVTVEPPFRASAWRGEIVTRAGRTVPVAGFRVAAGRAAWGGVLPLHVYETAAVRLVAADGGVLTAELPERERD